MARRMRTLAPAEAIFSARPVEGQVAVVLVRVRLAEKAPVGSGVRRVRRFFISPLHLLFLGAEGEPCKNLTDTPSRLWRSHFFFTFAKVKRGIVSATGTKSQVQRKWRVGKQVLPDQSTKDEGGQPINGAHPCSDRVVSSAIPQMQGYNARRLLLLQPCRV
jgi:hypothetical protein